MSKKNFKIQGVEHPNLSLPTIMHIDMDGFFASCEQQENPFLREKPIGVVPYISDGSTILASSYKAKALGITTGTKVRDAKKIYPDIILKLNDPPKYRYMHSRLMQVLRKLSPEVNSKSIDEAVLNFTQTQVNGDLGTYPPKVLNEDSINKHRKYMTKLVKKIKKEIKSGVGDYMKCSIGIGTNRFLAKVASNINKPDGFYYLHNSRLKIFYDILDLQDLHGVASKISARLNKLGIYTPNEFRNASLDKLKAEFKSFGYYWHLRLNGYEIDDYKSKRKSVGHSYHLPKFSDNKDYLDAIILKLTEKVSYRLRRLNLKARCFSIHCKYINNTKWQKSHRKKVYLDDTKSIYEEFKKLFNERENKKLKVRIIGISTSKFIDKGNENLDLFGEVKNNNKLYNTLDIINNKFGSFTIMPATLLKYKESAPDRIAFGK